MRATPRIGASLRDLLPEDEAAAVMAGHSRPKDGVASARLCPAIHLSSQASSMGAMDPRVKPGGDASPNGDASAKPLLLVEKLVKEYPRQGATATLTKLFARKPPVETEQFRAVDGISFGVGRGESVGLVGESGCGKSTTSMMVMRLLDPDLGPHRVRRRRDRRHHAQCVRAVAAAQEHPDGVSGSDRQPQSAVHRRARDRRSDHDSLATSGDVTRVRARCEELAGLVGTADQSIGSLPASIVGRAESARRHRSAPSRCTPSWSFSTSRPRRSMFSVQAVVLNLLHDLKQSMGMSYLIRVA